MERDASKFLSSCRTAFVAYLFLICLTFDDDGRQKLCIMIETFLIFKLFMLSFAFDNHHFNTFPRKHTKRERELEVGLPENWTRKEKKTFPQKKVYVRCFVRTLRHRFFRYGSYILGTVAATAHRTTTKIIIINIGLLHRDTNAPGNRQNVATYYLLGEKKGNF